MTNSTKEPSNRLLNIDSLKEINWIIKWGTGGIFLLFIIFIYFISVFPYPQKIKGEIVIEHCVSEDKESSDCLYKFKGKMHCTEKESKSLESGQNIIVEYFDDNSNHSNILEAVVKLDKDDFDNDSSTISFYLDNIVDKQNVEIVLRKKMTGMAVVTTSNQKLFSRFFNVKSTPKID